MRVHVVYAHPVQESFGAACHVAVTSALAGAGHEVDDLDLYAAGFDPRFSAEEHRRYQVVGRNLEGVDDLVARLRAAEGLVLVFPTWWYGMPAILKGWFDRVWLPGVGFNLPKGSGAILPALLNLKKFGVVTTVGSPWWFMKLYMREPGKRILLRGLKALCAPSARHVWLCQYGVDTSTPEQRSAFLRRIETTFAAF